MGIVKNQPKFETYLVGGAVRDQLLGLPIHERDWVVVGATPEMMLSLGFQPVGKEFPVFLHPETKEEYALARTERKVGKGYKGFVFYTDTKVTLLQDLQRRDLTINAMAQTAQGELIDPYGGLVDLKQKILRHVSPAFAEDPVRILRLARFAAKFPDFNVHDSTYTLMRSMVTAGEVNALVPERVWQELVRALMETAPARFWQVLVACGALPVLFPGLVLTEFSTQALNRSVALNASAPVRFAALMQAMSSDQLKKLCQHYRVPRVFSELALLISQTAAQYAQLTAADAEAIWLLLKSIDAMRRPERFHEYLLVHQASQPIQQAALIESILKNGLAAMQSVRIEPLLLQGLTGKDLAEVLKQQQFAAIRKALA